MFAIVRLRVPAAQVPEVLAAAGGLLTALAGRPGFRDGAVGRAADDDELLAVWTTWAGVGDYRRALSAAEVKIAGAPVWRYALDEPGAYLTD